MRSVQTGQLPHVAGPVDGTESVVHPYIKSSPPTRLTHPEGRSTAQPYR